MKSAEPTPLNGPHKELFGDGSLSGEGRVKDGKRHGKWTWYHKNGGLKAIGKYANGELDGYWEWWRESGKPLQAGSFDCGQQVGPWKRYYDNGQLWDEGDYDGGKKVGPCGPPLSRGVRRLDWLPTLGRPKVFRLRAWSVE